MSAAGEACRVAAPARSPTRPPIQDLLWEAGWRSNGPIGTPARCEPRPTLFTRYRPARPFDKNGFTLIEMLVVLAVLALVTGIAWPALDRAMRSQSFEAAANAIELGLRQARADAVARGRPVRFAMGEDRRSVMVGGGTIAIPEGVVVTLPVQGVAFFGDGTSNGGRIDLAGAGRERRLLVDSGSGAVREQR